MSEIQSYKDYLKMLDPEIKHTKDKPELPESVCGKDSKNVDNFLDNIPDDSLSELIKGISNTHCKNILDNALDFHTSAKSFDAAGLTEYGAMAVDARSKSASEYLKTVASSEDCDAVFYNQVATATLVSNVTCNSKDTVSNTGVSVKRTSVVTIDVGPTPEMVAAHNEALRNIQESIRDMLNSTQSDRVLLATNKTIQLQIDREQRNWNFSVRNSKFTLDTEDAIDMANTNNIKISDDAEVITSIKEKVKQEALLDITKTAEMGAPPENLKSYLQNKLNQMSDDKFLAIVKQANKTEFIKNSDTSITLRVTGYLDNVEVLLKDKNMVYVRSNIVMDAALKLAKEFSSDTVIDILAMSTAEIANHGLADFQKQLNDAIIAGQKDDGLFGGMFGGIFGGSVIFILLGGFIVYKLTLGGGLADMGTKIAIILIIVVVLYFGSAYMFSLWPFEDTSDKRIKNFNPIYTNANKLTNKLTNNNTKTPYSRRNQPYVEFNGYQGKLKSTQSSSKYQGGYLKRNKKSSKPYK